MPKNQIVGSYRVLDDIAEGGFGRTCKGEHILLKEPVCIKFCSEISKEYEEVLLDEARAMWDLRHYAIPAVRDVVRTDKDGLVLVTSYIPGPTLEQIVEKTGKLDPENVAWITERVLNGLKYIHFNSIIHGDIKPQNIIVQPKSHMAVIVDFGLSAIKPTGKSDAKGYTEYFSPPEQMRGEPPLPEADLYSLGMTMIYSLCGGKLDVLKRKEVPNYVPAELRDFIRRLVVRDPLSRPRWPESPADVDLCDELQDIRKKAFGRSRSAMKPIPGFDE